MDLFAVILVTITVITICGICLFIFVCALQPQILRRLHGQSIGLDDESFSNESDLNEDNQTTKKSIDKGPEDNALKSVQIQGRDRKVYLKDLEESLRTGRGIRTIDENNDEQSEEDSQNDPSNCFVHFIRKHLHRRS